MGRIPIYPDEAWTEDLPESTRRMVSTLTRPLLGRYGYLDEEETPVDEPVLEEVIARD